MDTLRHMIGLFLKIAFAFLFAAFIWWVVTLVSLGFSWKSVFVTGKTASSTQNNDILPSPRQYSGLLGTTTTPGVNTNVYKSTTAFNGYNNGGSGYSNSATGNYKYSTYTYDNNASFASNTYSYMGVEGDNQNTNNSGITSGKTEVPKQAGSSGNALLTGKTVRNLSIYEGGHIYTGLSFVGEARSSMFRDGKFPIVVIDQNRRVIGISAAVAESVWSTPGWVRFSTRINYPLPSKVACTMIFEEALTQKEKTRQPYRVGIPMMCN